jgi:hypothetical protein
VGVDAGPDPVNCALGRKRVELGAVTQTQGDLPVGGLAGANDGEVGRPVGGMAGPNDLYRTERSLQAAHALDQFEREV